MDLLLLSAAALILAIGLAHSILGERYILMRLFRQELPPLFGSDWFTRRTLRFAWHVTTLAWWGMGLILVGLAIPVQDPRRWVLLCIAATFLIHGLIAATASKGRHLSWLVFLAIGLATAVAV